MSLEVLANELLLELFEYFSTHDLFHTFIDLNARFNILLLTHLQKYHLDFRSISKKRFDTICQSYLPLISNRIISLTLSDDNETPDQINTFLSYGLILHGFINLRSLRLYHLRSAISMQIILTKCHQLPYLMHLNLIDCSFKNEDEWLCEQLNNIWSLSKLIHCHLDIDFENHYYIVNPSTISIALRRLSIESYSYGLNELCRLLENSPNLRYLSLLLGNDLENQSVVSFPIASISTLKLSVYESSSTTMIYLLKNVSHLRQLTVKTDEVNMNGHDWEQLITDHLVKLKVFELQMIFRLNDNDNKEQRVVDLLNSFRTRFWLIERQWYVRCDWNRCEQCDKNNIYLYTLPYAFDNYFVHELNFKSSSTYVANHDLYSSYDHVHTLAYELIPVNNTILTFYRFSNIYHLDLHLPFHESFFIMIPNLDQLITLRVEPYHVNDNFDPQNQFQTLLNRTSRLDSLTFINWSSSSKERPPYQYSNKSIRQLHLQDVERSYDNEQCASLIHSPLANQCEVLSISITNRMNLLDLIQKMTNLRALNVICQDDTWEINKDNLTSSSTDELIQWLIEHLPSTCVITRHNHSIQNNQQISFRPIHVWIR